MFYEKKEEYFFAVKEYNPLQYPLHVHQYIEYVRAEKGFLEMQIGKETYLIQEGDVAVIFPNVTHDYHTLSTTGNTQLNIINGYLDLLPLHKKLLLSKRRKSPADFIFSFFNVMSTMCKSTAYRLSKPAPSGSCL